jgi:hypothetical protein
MTLKARAVIYNQLVAIKNASKGLVDSQIIECVSISLDRALGGGASLLVFKTMKLVYGLDKSAIVTDLDLFEETLAKLLGEKHSSRVAAEIAKEMKALKSKRKTM